MSKIVSSAGLAKPAWPYAIDQVRFQELEVGTWSLAAKASKPVKVRPLPAAVCCCDSKSVIAMLCPLISFTAKQVDSWVLTAAIRATPTRASSSSAGCSRSCSARRRSANSARRTRRQYDSKRPYDLETMNRLERDQASSVRRSVASPRFQSVLLWAIISYLSLYAVVPTLTIHIHIHEKTPFICNYAFFSQSLLCDGNHFCMYLHVCLYCSWKINFKKAGRYAKQLTEIYY